MRKKVDIKQVHKLVSNYKSNKTNVHLDIDVYIDANYLRLEINYLYNFFKISNNFISEWYDIDFDYENISKDYYKYFTKELFNKLYIKVIDDFLINKKKIVRSHEVFSYFYNKARFTNSDENLELKNERQIKVENATKVLSVNFNTKYFIADEINKEELITKLHVLKKKASTLQEKNFFKEQISGLHKTDNLKNKYFDSYYSFKEALIELQSKNSEIKLGTTKLNIKNYDNKFLYLDFARSWKNFIETQEKGVDTLLTISAIDDTNLRKKNSVACIITNDSDFFPLFKRINLDRNIYWIFGDRGKESKALSLSVPEQRQIKMTNLLFNLDKDYYNILKTKYLSETSLFLAANFKPVQNFKDNFFLTHNEYSDRLKISLKEYEDREYYLNFDGLGRSINEYFMTSSERKEKENYEKQLESPGKEHELEEYLYYESIFEDNRWDFNTDSQFYALKLIAFSTILFYGMHDKVKLIRDTKSFRPLLTILKNVLEKHEIK